MENQSEFQPISVEAALTRVSEALDAVVGEIQVVGNLHGLTNGEGWRRFELTTYDGEEISARLPVATPPTMRMPRPTTPIENAEVLVLGRFGVQPLFGPLQFVASAVMVSKAKSEPSMRT